MCGVFFVFQKGWERSSCHLFVGEVESGSSCLVAVLGGHVWYILPFWGVFHWFVVLRCCGVSVASAVECQWRVLCVFDRHDAV